MNQTFSFARFCRILRKYFIDNRGQLLANLALLVAVLFVVFIFMYRSYPREVESARAKVIFFLGWGSWYLFIMQQVTVLNQNERAINYLMQPASQLEKIVLLWLVSGIGFLLVYVVTFTLFDYVGVTFVNNRHWTSDQLSQIHRIGGQLKIKPWYQNKQVTDVSMELWILTAIFHPIYMMVSLVVRRYTLALGVVLTMAIFLIGIVLNSSIMQLLTGNSTIRTAAPFMHAIVEAPNHSDWRVVTLTQPLGNQIRYAVAIAVVLLAYVTAYVRLKEREV